MKRQKVKVVTGEEVVVEKDNKMDVSDGIECIPYCPQDIAKISTTESALSRKFQVCNLTANHKHHIHIRGYVDYYGGYAEHTRNILYRLNDTGRYLVRLTNIPTPVDVDVFTWQRNNEFIYNVVDEECPYLCIAGPGWFQEKFLPNKGTIFGWTMIESRKYSDECAEWIDNADILLCPTDTDVRRAQEAGVDYPVKVHLGYDDKKYHPNVKPIQITGLENRTVFGVLGSWNCRKGIKQILRAYCSTFSKHEPVTLMLVCKYGTRPYGKDKEEDVWNILYEFDEYLKGFDRSKLPHITLLDIPVHENVLPHIMARFDCLVGFSSGESTWLPGIQALGMGIPVIQLASECSGFMEYLSDHTAYLCKDVKYLVATEELYKGTSEYYIGQEFAFGETEELANKMNEVYKDMHVGEYNKRLDNKIKAGIKIAEKWTWDKSIESLDKMIMGYGDFNG